MSLEYFQWLSFQRWYFLLKIFENLGYEMDNKVEYMRMFEEKFG